MMVTQMSCELFFSKTNTVNFQVKSLSHPFDGVLNGEFLPKIAERETEIYQDSQSPNTTMSESGKSSPTSKGCDDKGRLKTWENEPKKLKQ